MVQFRNISKRYGQLQVLKDVTVSIEAGRITAILGPNGSGKTTLLKCFLGLVHPDTGDILLADHRVNAHPEYRQRIGYMPQIAQFPEHLTVGEIIRMMKDIRSDVTQYDEEFASLILKEKIRKEKQQGKTIIFTSHILPEIAALADDVIFLLDGQLLFKEAKQVLIDRTGTKNLEEAIAEVLQYSGVEE